LVSLGYKYEFRPEEAQLPAEPLPENTCLIASDRRTEIPPKVSKSRRHLMIGDTGKISFQPNFFFKGNLFIIRF
jgi:hypothetical protein